MTTKESGNVDITEEAELHNLREALRLTEQVRQTLVLPDGEREEAQSGLLARFKRMQDRLTPSGSD